MQARKEKTGWIVVLEKNEELKATMESWARKENIEGACVQGIGGITDVELAAFDLAKNKWVRKRFAECANYELLSINGNINKDGLHAHLVISDLEFKVSGGHLLSAKISTFGEIFVMPTEAIAKVRLLDADLKKIDLSKK